MGWLIALAVISLLAVLPLGISAKYDEQGPQLWGIAGPVRWKLLPGKKKTKDTEKKPEEAKKKKVEKPASEKTEKKGGSVTDFVPLVRIVFDFLADFRRKLRVKILELKIVLAGGDPCDLAVNYGKACAAVAALDPQLERFFVIKKKDVQVQCDFVEDKTLIIARLDLTITLGWLIVQLFRHGSRALKELLKIMKLRKGGVLQ
ncbi:MAG: hypothetical protein IJF02_03975 [Oscillospiraceae bacterium]|nr:hypothetical protein [Oscillospiraceae bacterium]